MLEKIGIVISGCKRDFGVIADNNVVNLNDSAISKIMIDVRKHVLLHKTYVDFYSVEFVKNYSVITGYRSSKDLGRDGYIAVSLFVDCSYYIVKVRNLLKELLDCYFKNYMNPLTWEPQVNKNVDIKRFQLIVDQYEVVPLSAASDIIPGEPKYQIYDNEDTLDSYLEGSLLSDFAIWQKVYYLSKPVAENRDHAELHIQPVSGSVQARPLVVEREEEKEDEETVADTDEDEEDMPPIIEVPPLEDPKKDKSPTSKSSKKRVIGIAAVAIFVILLGAFLLFPRQNGNSASEAAIQVGLIEDVAEKEYKPSSVEADDTNLLDSTKLQAIDIDTVCAVKQEPKEKSKAKYRGTKTRTKKPEKEFWMREEL